jgi:cell wall-associated NlpC family hydrolase
MDRYEIKTNNNTGSYLYGFMRFSVLVGVVLLFSGCASSPDIKPGVIGSVKNKAAIVDYALSLEDTPYHYGKSSPEEGFDCSGFVQHVYKQYGKSLPRRAQDMAHVLPAITKAELMPGDLVFFNTNGRAYSHVGIYIEDDEFIHAPSQRTGRVLVSDLNNQYWRKHFTGARRP